MDTPRKILKEKPIGFRVPMQDYVNLLQESINRNVSISQYVYEKVMREEVDPAPQFDEYRLIIAQKEELNKELLKDLKAQGAKIKSIEAKLLKESEKVRQIEANAAKKESVANDSVKQKDNDIKSSQKVQAKQQSEIESLKREVNILKINIDSYVKSEQQFLQKISVLEKDLASSKTECSKALIELQSEKIKHEKHKKMILKYYEEKSLLGVSEESKNIILGRTL